MPKSSKSPLDEDYVIEICPLLNNRSQTPTLPEEKLKPTKKAIAPDLVTIDIAPKQNSIDISPRIVTGIANQPLAIHTDSSAYLKILHFASSSNIFFNCLNNTLICRKARPMVVEAKQSPPTHVMK